MVQAICRYSGSASGIYRSCGFRSGESGAGSGGLPRSSVSSVAPGRLSHHSLCPWWTPGVGHPTAFPGYLACTSQWPARGVGAGS